MAAFLPGNTFGNIHFYILQPDECFNLAGTFLRFLDNGTSEWLDNSGGLHRSCHQAAITEDQAAECFYTLSV